MKRIKTLTEKTMKSTVVKGGCGECQTSCQSACKTYTSHKKRGYPAMSPFLNE